MTSDRGVGAVGPAVNVVRVSRRVGEPSMSLPRLPELDALRVERTRPHLRQCKLSVTSVGTARADVRNGGWVMVGYALRPDLTARPSRLSVQRRMSAAPSALFRCWTDRFDHWFAAPGTLVASAEVGAPFFFEAREQQRRTPHFGRLLRAQRDQLLEFTWSTCATRGEETVVTVELSAEGQGTRLRLSHEGFPDERSREQHETAWHSILAELDRLTG